MKIENIIRLSDMLAEMAYIRRATRLPNKDFESDSHHSFSLALIAYHVCVTKCPELNIEKVLLYALAHDLTEIITGDEDTLHYTKEQHAAKKEREKNAHKEFEKLFKDYPEVKSATNEYEKLDTPEAATVFVLDKACTTWTHFADSGMHAREERGMVSKKSVDKWANNVRDKINDRLNAQPPKAIIDLFDDSFKKLRELFDD